MTLLDSLRLARQLRRLRRYLQRHPDAPERAHLLELEYRYGQLLAEQG